MRKGQKGSRGEGMTRNSRGGERCFFFLLIKLKLIYNYNTLKEKIIKTN